MTIVNDNNIAYLGVKLAKKKNILTIDVDDRINSLICLPIMYDKH